MIRPAKTSQKAYRPPSVCVNDKPHEFKKYRQVIQPEFREDYSGPMQAYFVVMGCEKCKRKEYVDLVIG